MRRQYRWILLSIRCTLSEFVGLGRGAKQRLGQNDDNVLENDCIEQCDDLRAQVNMLHHRQNAFK
jgi:hypothetical protein